MHFRRISLSVQLSSETAKPNHEVVVVVVVVVVQAVSCSHWHTSVAFLPSKAVTRRVDETFKRPPTSQNKVFKNLPQIKYDYMHLSFSVVVLFDIGPRTIIFVISALFNAHFAVGSKVTLKKHNNFQTLGLAINLTGKKNT